MIRHITTIPSDVAPEYFEEFVDTSVCLSKSRKDLPSEEIACGELQHVDEDGVVIWHIGDARSFGWDEFDEVITFYG